MPTLHYQMKALEKHVQRMKRGQQLLKERQEANKPKDSPILAKKMSASRSKSKKSKSAKRKMYL